MPQRVLLTGATGFIGRNLYRPLEAAGYDVRCLTRKLEEAQGLWPERQWVRGDIGDPGRLPSAMEGCDFAFYLVHGMGSHRPGWAEEELRWARNFAQAAEQAGVSRIVYLGGVAPQGTPSEHLLSRLNTGEALRAGQVPCLELRAGMIIGARQRILDHREGSSRPTPGHGASRVARGPGASPWQWNEGPSALLAGLRIELPESTWWDIPGPEALSGKEILLRVAAVLGRKPLLIKVPLVTPRLSSHWIRLVTRADYSVARELVEGLTSDLLATRRGFWTKPDSRLRWFWRKPSTEPSRPKLGLMATAGRLAESIAGFLTPRAKP